MNRRFRLSQEADFQDLFGRGKRINTPLFRLIYKKNTIGHIRLALITPRAVDKRAVKRNLIRRRTREWIRKHENLVNRPIDIALVFKKEAGSSPKNIFYEELDKLFSRISSP